MLRASPYFDVEARTNYTKLIAEEPIQIEILAPPALFQEQFDTETEVISIDGVKTLKPALLLNAKCGAIVNRATEEKHWSDFHDIIFLLEFCAPNPQYLPKAHEFPQANKELVQQLFDKHEGKEIWVRAGYSFETGSLCLAPLKTILTNTRQGFSELCLRPKPRSMVSRMFDGSSVGWEHLGYVVTCLMCARFVSSFEYHFYPVQVN